MKTYIIIPARFDSSRLPGKVLCDIAGKPMIAHVYERALEANVGEVVVATDDERVSKSVCDFGGQVCMTGSSHRSGTERIAEVIDKLSIKDEDGVINLQGDEPLIDPAIIKQVAENLSLYKEASMITVCEPIAVIEDVFNVNINKVVRDHKGYAIYFSRAPIPWYRDGFKPEVIHKDKKLPENFDYYRHIGIYGYLAGFVKKYIAWAPSPIEQIESLEQLRVLWYGEKIHVDIAAGSPGPGIDTPEDLNKIQKLFPQTYPRNM